MRDAHPLPIIDAYFRLNQLKQLYRQGWLKHGIPPECIELADFFRSAELAVAEPALHDVLDALKGVRWTEKRTP